MSGMLQHHVVSMGHEVHSGAKERRWSGPGPAVGKLKQSHAVTFECSTAHSIGWRPTVLLFAGTDLWARLAHADHVCSVAFVVAACILAIPPEEVLQIVLTELAAQVSPCSLDEGQVQARLTQICLCPAYNTGQ